MPNEDKSVNDLAHQILDKINQKLTEYDNQPEIEKIREAIWDANILFKNEADIIANELVKIYQSYLEYKKTNNQSENIYDYDLIARVQVLKDLINSGYEESKKELLRVKYNTIITNQIFRLLNILLNNNNEYKQGINSTFLEEIRNNLDIFKINLSIFMLHIIFEDIKVKMEQVVYGNINDVEASIDELLVEYNNDSQLLGIVLNSIRKDINGTTFHSTYSRIRTYLISKGYNGAFKSIFSQIRNSSSHGEFYPSVDNNGEMNIELIDDNGTSINITKQDLFNYLNGVISFFPKGKKYELFLEFFNSNDLINTLEKIKDEGKEEEALKFFSMLLSFNLVEYNYEQFLQKLLIDNNPIKKKIETIDVKKYFDTSYDKGSATNEKILETIKHSLGHVNVQYANGKIVFENKKRNESCECSLLDLINFAMNSGIHQVDIATEFYQQYKYRVEKRIRDLYNISKEKIKLEDNYTYNSNNLIINGYIDNINKKYK